MKTICPAVPKEGRKGNIARRFSRTPRIGPVNFVSKLGEWRTRREGVVLLDVGRWDARAVDIDMWFGWELIPLLSKVMIWH